MCLEVGLTISNITTSTRMGDTRRSEAYTRDEFIGDQYSNFNAGKILLYLEGFAGIDYSLPDNELRVHENMPKGWQWMEFQIPMVRRMMLNHGTSGTSEISRVIRLKR